MVSPSRARGTPTISHHPSHRGLGSFAYACYNNRGARPTLTTHGAAAVEEHPNML